MSSDSDDDFSYTNTASMLKALKKDISFSEEKNTSLQVESSIKNEDSIVLNASKQSICSSDEENTSSQVKNSITNKDFIILDSLKDNQSPIKNSQSKLDISIVEEMSNQNDSCILLSDEDLQSSPANLISKIDSVLVNGRSRKTRSSLKRNCKTKGRGRGRNISATRQTKQTTHTRQTRQVSKNLANRMSTSSAADACILGDNTELQEANYEVDVKVLWMSQYLKKFCIRRFDKLQPIFKYFSEREDTPENKLIFTIEKDAVILSRNDTPDSLNINAATIIEGGIRTDKNQSITTNKQEKDCIEIKVQFKDKKRPLTITTRRLDRMEVLMHKTAAALDVDVKHLKFYFDGDFIKSNDTVHDLQLEGGECIDCIKFN